MEPTTIALRVDDVMLEGQLVLPPAASAIVMLVPGDGFCASSCYADIARVLEHEGIGTLRMELLTSDEEQLEELGGEAYAPLALVAHRIIAVVDRLRARPDAHALRVGYFGSGRGAAAALMAAAERPGVGAAVVSLAGRVDLVETVLPAVHAPTLLICANEAPELAVHRRAFHALRCEKFLSIVSDLFQPPEPHAEAARETALWCSRHLVEHMEPAVT